MDWLRVQSVNDCFRISQLHLLGVYPQHQCLHCASNCMCGHCAEVKPAELGSFCYCCLFTLPPPKKVKLSFSQAKKKKKGEKLILVYLAELLILLWIETTLPPHTHVHSLVSVLLRSYGWAATQSHLKASWKYPLNLLRIPQRTP